MIKSKILKILDDMRVSDIENGTRYYNMVVGEEEFGNNLSAILFLVNTDELFRRAEIEKKDK